MTADFNIALDWERIQEGTTEEKACFGLLTIRHGSLVLTEGLDGFIDRSRTGPLVSGYHLAEWLAWNWWRLVNEPRPQVLTGEWELAHRFATIGAGYVWPNITVFSDRERTVVIAKPTRPQNPMVPFRFTADWSVVMPTRDFETAVELFMARIQGKLRAEAVADTNFDRIWAEVQAERSAPEVAGRRRLEALLGFDPDEGSTELIDQLLADAPILGLDAVQEVAADHQPGRPVPARTDFIDLAAAYGNATRPVDMIHLSPSVLSPRALVPAWTRGYDVARAVREQADLDLTPLSNQRLAELCAVSPSVLERSEAADLAFSIDDERGGDSGHIVLRSKWETGRRFEMARLLGDRITNELQERLLPATRAYTYRQKLQRAFAAGLLCPFEALEEKLAGDYSATAREDAAHHFNVSELTVTSILVNNHRLERDYLEDDWEESAS